MTAEPSELPSIEEIAQSVRAVYRTAEDMVAAAIRRAILEGAYAPGERLPQEKLARALGTCGFQSELRSASWRLRG